MVEFYLGLVLMEIGATAEYYTSSKVFVSRDLNGTLVLSYKAGDERWCEAASLRVLIELAIRRTERMLVRSPKPQTAHHIHHILRKL